MHRSGVTGSPRRRSPMTWPDALDIGAAGVGVVMPGDRDWPAALTDLGEREPFVLWTRGAASFLSRPFTDLLTITGSRAATSYGEHVAAEFAAHLARDGRVVVTG